MSNDSSGMQCPTGSCGWPIWLPTSLKNQSIVQCSTCFIHGRRCRLCRPRWSRAGCSPSTWPPRPNCPAAPKRWEKPAVTPSHRPGRRCSGPGIRSGWRSAPSIGWSGTPRSCSPLGGWRPVSSRPPRSGDPADPTGACSRSVPIARGVDLQLTPGFRVRARTVDGLAEPCGRRCLVPHEYPGDRAAEGRNRIDPALAAQIRVLEDEVTLLRRRLTESPRHVRLLEERLAEASASVAQLTERNAKLVETLREARSQLLALREEVDRLAQPPSGHGVFLSCFDDGSVDVFTSGPRLRGAGSPAGEIPQLRRGQAARPHQGPTAWGPGTFESTGDGSARP